MFLHSFLVLSWMALSFDLDRPRSGYLDSPSRVMTSKGSCRGGSLSIHSTFRAWQRAPDQGWHSYYCLLIARQCWAVSKIHRNL
ncbi:hypothetical protein F5883DRAFT_535472 [Diaporthe sp. PMI_573]|nr:hypothetical protein F5883DRAFT_535472 [Diaporthaceae sp. PMI_573]